MRGGRGAPRGRGVGRGGNFNGHKNFQWRRNGVPAGPDRPANPGPSRPANPGPNNPNYNLNHAPWPPEDNWPRTPPSPSHHFDNQYGFDNHSGRSREFRDHPPRDTFGGEESHFDSHSDTQHFDHPPRYDHHTMIETEKRHQSLLQSSPHHLDNRRPPSPRVFWPASPSKTNNIIDLSDSPNFINERSPRYENANSNDRWTHDENQFDSNPTDPIQFQIRENTKKFIDYSVRVNPLDDIECTSPVHPDDEHNGRHRSHKSRETRRDSREQKDSDNRSLTNRHRREESRSPRRKKKSKDKRESSSRHRSSYRSSKRAKRKALTPDKEYTEEPMFVESEIYDPDNADDNQELYEPDSGNDAAAYIPSATGQMMIQPSDKHDDSVAVPKEYKDVSVYMTQVLETMIERQRLEMHQKLNEMFKTYFDAKEMELNQVDQAEIKDQIELKKDDDDDDLDKLRQAAIRSSETKRTFENNDLSNDTEELVAESTDLTEPIKSDQKQQFANFDQFKKYKQKMREQGRTDQSLIVSIPNISAEGVDLDAELNLTSSETVPERTDQKDSNDVTLQVQIENNDDSTGRRKISTEAIPTEVTTEEENKPEPIQQPKPQSEDLKPKQPAAPKPTVIKTSDLTHRDAGKHWCSVTTKWLNSIHDLLKHLHSDEYQAKLPSKDKPWKRRLDIFQTKLKEREEMNDVLKRTAELAKGSEFFVPIQAFKCRLCDKIFRTEADMMCHFLGSSHNKKYDEMNFKDSNYEYQRLQRIQVAVKEQQKALEHQKNAYREKLEQKRRLAERKGAKATNSAVGKLKVVNNVTMNNNHQPVANTATSVKDSVDDVLRDVSRKLEEEKKPDGDGGTRESSVLSAETTEKKGDQKPDRKRKPRSAAIERILAMTKRKRVSKKTDVSSASSTPQDGTPIGSPAEIITPVNEEDQAAKVVPLEIDEDKEKLECSKETCDNSANINTSEFKPPIQISEADKESRISTDSLPADDDNMDQSEGDQSQLVIDEDDDHNNVKTQDINVDQLNQNSSLNLAASIDSKKSELITNIDTICTPGDSNLPPEQCDAGQDSSNETIANSNAEQQENFHE